jgi:hypothetical protein
MPIASTPARTASRCPRSGRCVACVVLLAGPLLGGCDPRDPPKPKAAAGLEQASPGWGPWCVAATARAALVCGPLLREPPPDPFPTVADAPARTMPVGVVSPGAPPGAGAPKQAGLPAAGAQEGGAPARDGRMPAGDDLPSGTPAALSAPRGAPARTPRRAGPNASPLSA